MGRATEGASVTQSITPNLWFNGNADEAVDYYVSVFPNSRVVSRERYPESAAEGLADFQLDRAGKTLVVIFELDGQRFAAINGGPEFVLHRGSVVLRRMPRPGGDRLLLGGPVRRPRSGAVRLVQGPVTA